MSKRKNKKIIDFRVRPPLVPFKIRFDLKRRRLTWENKPLPLYLFTQDKSIKDQVFHEVSFGEGA